MVNIVVGAAPGTEPPLAGRTGLGPTRADLVPTYVFSIEDDPTPSSNAMKVVPDQYIVISGSHGGALALRVRGEDTGSVWWVDYDVADEEDIYEPSEDVMRRLADDFDSFLALF